MAIEFNCSQCQAVLQTPDDSVGRKCKCPTCGYVMQVPMLAELVSPPSDLEPINPYASLPTNPFVPSMEPVRTMQAAPHRGDTVMVLGVLSLITSVFGCGCCGVSIPIGVGLGLPAVIMGRGDLQSMDAGMMDPTGRSNTKGGMICGIIGLAFCGLGIFFFLMQFGGMIVDIRP